ncbi:hypothetical protein PSHT_08158 [Puccinia striiformis]|uniref:Uncharacterized protein n=1 Tax=Puccinia striiformis TaxID=27350 RepID=A0A2S4VRM7_9BASI|nr:hypothetical protein PSHT_08158 [Puccinia striiformis]
MKPSAKVCLVCWTKAVCPFANGWQDTNWSVWLASGAILAGLGRGSPDIASREFTALLARHPVVILKSIPKLMLLDGDAGGFEAAKAYQFGTKKQAYQVDMNAPQAQLISVRLRS